MQRAFLLEDDQGNAQVMRKFLEHYGIEEILLHEDLASAREALSDTLIATCDLWVIDNYLPDGSSQSFALGLRNRGARNICLYTACTTSSEIPSDAKSIFDVVFEKPLRFGKLREELDRLLESQDAAQG